MNIQNISSFSNIRNVENIEDKDKTNVIKEYDNDFKSLFQKMTGETIAREIKNTYDVNLNIGNIGIVNDFLSNYDIRCKNFVCISQKTLIKMEKNPILKKKVMYAIEEFCSPKEQAKINALCPPVKSAGMVIYPDGDTLFWLEGYPNDFDNTKNKKMIVSTSDISNTQKLYENTSINSMGDDMNSAMQILGGDYINYIYKKR